jgi:hypothetical protein
MKHNIRIRMGSQEFSVVRGNEKPINLRGTTPRELHQVSSILIEYLNKKGFFK